MKTFHNYITENQEQTELKIMELSYYDFINLCDIYKTIKFKDKYGYTICKIISQVKQQPEVFSKKSNKFHFLVAVKNKEILGVFYKQLGGNPDKYDTGYIISKGAGKELFAKMRELGSYNTFSNISNISSIKSQLSMGAEILYINNSEPNQDGTYDNTLSEENIESMKDEKFYYKDGDDEFFFFDEKAKLKLKELKTFLLEHNRIEVIDKAKLSKKLYIYFLFNKK